MDRYSILLGKTPPPEPPPKPFYMGIDMGFRCSSDIVMGHLEPKGDGNVFVLDYCQSLQEDSPERLADRIRTVRDCFAQKAPVKARMDAHMGQGFFGPHSNLPCDKIQVTKQWKEQLNHHLHYVNIQCPSVTDKFQDALNLALSLTVEPPKPTPVLKKEYSFFI